MDESALTTLGDAVRALLPDGVALAVEAPRIAPGALLPGEEAAIARAVAKRQAEFTGGRVAARRALAALGFEPVALLAGADRAPRWPPGAVGSISHTSGVCLAAAARADRFASLGLDVEGAAPLEPGLWARVLTPGERAWLEARPEAERGPLAKLAFSVKEAAYKAQHPLTGRFLGFQDVALRLDLAAGAFEARLAPVEGPRSAIAAVRGRFASAAGHVVSVAFVPAG